MVYSYLKMYTISWNILNLFFAYIYCSEYFQNEYNKGLIPSSALSVQSGSVFQCALKCVNTPNCSASSFTLEKQECLLDHLSGAGYPDFISNNGILVKRLATRVKINTPDLYKYKFLDDYGLQLRGTILKFSVKACAAALLGLFTDIGDHDMYMYEIVLGGSGNTVQTIRRGKRQTNIVIHYEVLLSCTEYINLWISWSNGEICVGKGEETTNTSTVFMQWIDPDPLDIKHVGVLTRRGETGDWVF